MAIRNILLSFFFFQFALIAQESDSEDSLVLPKKPDGVVNDYANVLSGKEAQAIYTSFVYDIMLSSSDAIKIAIFPSALGGDPREITRQLAAKWRCCNSDVTDELLVVLFIAEKKAAIQQGKRLKQNGLSDEKLQTIVVDKLQAYFEKGKYDRGLKKLYNRLVWEISRTEAVRKNSRLGILFCEFNMLNQLPFYLFTGGALIFFIYSAYLSYRFWNRYRV